MSKRTSTQPKRFECAKCGPVIFRVEETETTGEDGEVISTTTDRVKGFGTCAVFKKSGGSTIESILLTCPVYAEHFSAPVPESQIS